MVQETTYLRTVEAEVGAHGRFLQAENGSLFKTPSGFPKLLVNSSYANRTFAKTGSGQTSQTKLLSERNKSANFPGMHTGGGKPASTSTSISQIFGGLEVLKQPGPMLRTTLVGKVCTGALLSCLKRNDHLSRQARGKHQKTYICQDRLRTKMQTKGIKKENRRFEVPIGSQAPRCSRL